MHKKKKITIIIISLLTALILALGIGVTTIILKRDNNPINNINGPNKEPSLNFDELETDILTSIGIYDIKPISTHKRNVQKEVYETELMKKYHKDYGFVYPGYNRNYEIGRNRYFTNNSGQEIDGLELVYNERVYDNIKYNDQGWIRQEIAIGTFKKHPAADYFFKNDISNIDAQKTHFTLSTAIKGPYGTGLYAPPGEIIKLAFDDQTWDLISKNNWNGMSIVINQNFWDNKPAPNSGQISNRYPFLQTHFGIDNKNKTIKFGSPFGGSITIRINNSFNMSDGFPIGNQNIPVSFTIDGAIPSMFYQDGVTTYQDWENQKQLVLKNQLAPIIQGTGPYLTFSLPFTDLNVAGHYPVEKLNYPKDNFKKWNDFLYLSNYYAARDLNNNIIKLDMEFCDDIWGGAAAWGGGNTFYCPTDWGITAFFRDEPIQVFNPKNSWGVFHEINHNYQQNSAFFRRNSHGETNQVTTFNLSVIGDAGRLRSDTNFTGEPERNNNDPGWSRIASPYINIWDLRRAKARGVKNTNDEYPIYSLLLFLLGSKNYVDYVRWDTANHPSSSENWNGFDEIKTISEYFKINLFPAFFDYSWYWKDWKLESELNAEEKNIVKEISTKYKAVDFVANLYASGIYLYNNNTGKQDYTGDITSPFEIIAGKPFTFNLNQFILSVNDKFTWNDLIYPKKTKNGGSLEYDPLKKHLTYTPPINNFYEIDEFDISIIPSQWENKPKNYVPEIKWKIKVRQVVNEPTFELYDFDNWNTNHETLLKELETIDTKKKPIITMPLGIFNTNMFRQDRKQGAQIKFKFSVPQTGTYDFYSKWSQAITIKVNKKTVYTHNNRSTNLTKTFSKYLKKGEVIEFDIYHVGSLWVNNSDQDRFNFVAKIDKKEINLIKNSISPYHSIVTNESINEIISNPNYKYKDRQIDRSIFINDISNNINLSDYQFPIIPVKSKNENNVDVFNYNLKSKYGNNVQSLNNYGTDYFELWNSDHAPGQAASEFEVIYSKPEKVASLFFGHRTNNHYNARATNIKVTGFADENDTKGVILFEGEYGKQFNDRNRDYSILNLDKTLVVKKLKIEAFNTKQNALIWQWFRSSSVKYNKIHSSIGMNNENFKYQGHWIIRRNDEDNQSAINNVYVKSINKNDSLEFELLNSVGFNLVGKSTNIATNIDVYVNDIKINSQPIKIQSNKDLYNHSLYTYFTNLNAKNLKIKIVHLDNNPLYLNFVMKF